MRFSIITTPVSKKQTGRRVPKVRVGSGVDSVEAFNRDVYLVGR